MPEQEALPETQEMTVVPEPEGLGEQAATRVELPQRQEATQEMEET